MVDIAHEGAIYYYHYDGLGSVVALSDGAGDIVERYTYDVFGEATILAPNGEPRTISSYGNPYMFTGRRFDTETGLYYYRARYYEPKLGRFLQTDRVAMYMQYASVGKRSRDGIPGTYLFPSGLQKFMQYDPIGRYLQEDPAGRFLQNNALGFPVELNLYPYCGNNPVIFVDPYGQGWKSIVGTGLGIIGGGIVLAATSPAWITAGAVIGIGGVGLVVWDIYDDSKMLEHPPGDDAFKDHTKQLDDEMDNYPVDDNGSCNKGS